MNRDFLAPASETYRNEWDAMPRVRENPSSPDTEIVGTRYLRLLWRHKFFLFAAMMLGGVGAAGYVLLTPPLFKSVATIEVQGRNEKFLNMGEVDQTVPGASFNWQMEVAARLAELKSRLLADRVIEVLGLDNDPDFGAGNQSTWRSALKKLLLPGSRPLSRNELALERLSKETDIAAAPQSGTIYISVSDRRPERATAIANAYVNEYTKQKNETHKEILEQTQNLLTEQLVKLQETIHESERQLQAYAADHNIAFAGHDDSAQEANLKSLQTALAEAQANFAQKKSQLATAETASPEKLAGVANNPVLQNLQIALSELKSQQAGMLATLETSNPQAEAIAKQIATVRQSIESERRHTLDRIRTDYVAARNRVQILSNTVQQQEQRVTRQMEGLVGYNTLKGEVESNQALYRAFFQKASAASLAAALNSSDIRVVDLPMSNGPPLRRNALLNVIAGATSGLILATIFVLLRAAFDKTLQSSDEASRLLPVTMLAAIPLLPKSARLGRWRRRRAMWQPETPTADSFRGGATSILFASEELDVSSPIAVTSPNRGDGKTTIAVNLGAALAESGRRTILLDLDFRQPALHLALGVANGTGMAEFLGGADLLDPKELIRATALPGVWVITAGHPGGHPASLLTSSRLPQLLESLRRMFDVVLLDSPPLIFSDARRAAHVAGGALLVFRASRTQRDQAALAAALLARDRTPVLGMIFNACPQITRSYRTYVAYRRT